MNPITQLKKKKKKPNVSTIFGFQQQKEMARHVIPMLFDKLKVTLDVRQLHEC
jgi:hypothetical protein